VDLREPDQRTVVLDYASNGVDFQIRSAANGKCVNVSGASYTNNAHIILWTCGNFPNEFFEQTFTVVNGELVPPGAYFWFSASPAPSMVLNVSGGSTANGAHLILYGAGAFSNEYVLTY